MDRFPGHFRFGLDTKSALCQTMWMSSHAPLPASESSPERSEENPLLRPILAAIKTLVEGLSPEERARVLSEITEIIRPISAPRAGEILGKIIKLLPRQKNWTVEELKQQVAEEGIEAEPKEVYNAVSYLARKGHIRRIGYGRYVVDGVEIVTAEDLGGPSSRHEDGYRLDWEGKREGE